MSSSGSGTRLSGAEWSLGIQWVIVTAIGWVIGFFVCETFVQGLTFPGTVVEGAVIGTFVGLGQGWAMRSRGAGIWWWTLASIVGFAIGKAVGELIAGNSEGVLGYLVTGATIGVVVGLAQWLALRRMAGAAWWIPASVVGWAAGWSLVALANQSDDLSTLAVYVAGAGGAAIAGIVTAAALIRILRGSRLPGPA